MHKRQSVTVALLVQCIALFAATAEEIPLKLHRNSSPEGWHLLSFGDTKPNIVSEHPASLTISVNNSAGPLVYGFDSVKKFTGIRIQGTIDDLIRLSPNRKQGAKGSDDYALRLGVILTGDRKLGALERKFAPTWIKELESLSPAGSGLGEIHFYNVENGSGSGWTRRTHPLGKGLIKEEIARTLTQPGPIDFEIQFEKELSLSGLWIACDGDDTHSKFKVTINRIEMISR
ncbi:MAG: hypothetical protein P1U89_10975 [Verrucomicrobiales bacterium]|nr:hypothetical protein [Verrucomicrobiales bacterium]